MSENMLLPLQYMRTCPLCYSDLPLVGLVIELAWVGLRVAVTVVVGSTMVVDFAVEMAWMVDMQNFVVEMAWTMDIVDMEMAVDIVLVLLLVLFLVLLRWLVFITISSPSLCRLVWILF